MKIKLYYYIFHWWIPGFPNGKGPDFRVIQWINEKKKKTHQDVLMVRDERIELSRMVSDSCEYSTRGIFHWDRYLETSDLGENTGYVLEVLYLGFSGKSKYWYPAGSWIFRSEAQKRNMEWRMGLTVTFKCYFWNHGQGQDSKFLPSAIFSFS